MAFSKFSTEKIWQEISKKSEEEKRQLLEWQLQAREPIHKFSDMRPGDHLIKRFQICGKILYYHHFLCIESNNGKPKIIHYTNTYLNAIIQAFKTASFSSGSALGQLATVKEMTLPNDDFLSNEEMLQEKGGEVERVVWPDELKRYGVKEVVTRARKRKDEKFYDLAKNNCESFVMWCLCDINISLQATNLVSFITDCLKSTTRTAYQLLKIAVEKIPEKILGRTCFGNDIGCFGKGELSGQGSTLRIGDNIGLYWTILVQLCILCMKIMESKRKWDDGLLITNRKEFIKEIIDELIGFLCRSGGSIGGMVLGEFFIPIPFDGAFVGMLFGTFAGDFLSKQIPENICLELLLELMNSSINYINSN